MSHSPAIPGSLRRFPLRAWDGQSQRRGLQTQPQVVERSQDAAVSRIPTTDHGRVGFRANRILPGAPQIVTAGAMMPQIGRHEFINFRQRGFTPARPSAAAPRRACRRESSASQKSARHAAGFGLGVEDVA